MAGLRFMQIPQAYKIRGLYLMTAAASLLDDLVRERA